MTTRCSNPLPHPGPHPFNANGTQAECDGVQGELAPTGDMREMMAKRAASKRLLIVAQGCNNALADMLLLGLPIADQRSVEHAAIILASHQQHLKVAKGKVV